jgi:dihydrodiol dehydrogenase / D-xylose 1-dehydrogenase (NADP)
MAKQFVEDLLVDPTTRDVKDIKHVVRAVCSSSSVDRAKTFIKDVIGGTYTNRCRSRYSDYPIDIADAEAVAYGSLEELVRDPEVDAVYISTPTSVHYANAKACLEAKKPVLCEVRHCRS